MCPCPRLLPARMQRRWLATLPSAADINMNAGIIYFGGRCSNVVTRQPSSSSSSRTEADQLAGSASGLLRNTTSGPEPQVRTTPRSSSCRCAATKHSLSPTPSVTQDCAAIGMYARPQRTGPGSHNYIRYRRCPGQKRTWGRRESNPHWLEPKSTTDRGMVPSPGPRR